MECPLSEVPLYTEFSTKSILVVVACRWGINIVVHVCVWGGGGGWRGVQRLCYMYIVCESGWVMSCCPI